MKYYNNNNKNKHFFCCKQHMANQESTRESVAAVTELIWLTEPQVIHLSHV